MSERPGLEEHLQSLECFRDWLQSLVAAQQPLDEWSMSQDDLRQRWLPRLQERNQSSSSLYF
ncbi:MAG: hypothetical protein ACO3GW_01530 [Vulcanococcus sp.]